MNNAAPVDSARRAGAERGAADVHTARGEGARRTGIAAAGRAEHPLFQVTEAPQAQLDSEGAAARGVLAGQPRAAARTARLPERRPARRRADDIVDIEDPSGC